MEMMWVEVWLVDGDQHMESAQCFGHFADGVLEVAVPNCVNGMLGESKTMDSVQNVNDGLM